MKKLEELLEMREISKVYKTGENKTKALSNINLKIYKGQFVAIVGKSGSGKSTLLNILSGIDKPTEGSVLFKGKNITKYNEKELAKWRGENVGIVFQFFQLMPTLTVRENIILPMEFVSRYSKEKTIQSKSSRNKIAIELMQKTGIEQLAAKFPSEISGGEQQRTAVARALANNPQILIADEPTGNLDTETTEQVMQLFSSLIRSDKTILMVTHNNDLAERADRIITIKDGTVLTDISEEWI